MSTKRKGSLRYPIVEGCLDSMQVGGRIHDILVVVEDLQSGKCVKFMYFFRRGCHLPHNVFISGEARSVVLGDVVVMRIGSRFDAPVVNMRRGDAAIADWLVPR